MHLFSLIPIVTPNTTQMRLIRIKQPAKGNTMLSMDIVSTSSAFAAPYFE